MTPHEAKTYIKSRLPDTEILAQLAEECSELAQAAHKLRRALDGTNPTPVTAGDARKNLLEEYLDVIYCFGLIATPEEWARIDMDDGGKLQRWAERLQEKEAHK